jgi:hypothetical protein
VGRLLTVPLALLLISLCLTGCHRLGERVELRPLPAGAPEAGEILASLAANDKAIRNFKATGSFTLESPDLSAVQRFSFGLIEFRRPADLFVVGRNNLGMALFELICVGNEFIIYFPADKSEEPYYRLEGEKFDGVPFSVSPSEIAREMFLPEEWDKLTPKDVRLTEYNPEQKTALMEIGPKRAPWRRLSLTAAAGNAWVVTKSERLDKKGAVLAVTTRGEYRDVEGVIFPALIDASFPGQQTRMMFDMRKIFPNTKLNDADFEIRTRASKAGWNLEELARKSKYNEQTDKTKRRAKNKKDGAL